MLASREGGLELEFHLPGTAGAADSVAPWQPAEGRHMGFASGGSLEALRRTVLDWMAANGAPKQGDWLYFQKPVPSALLPDDPGRS